jgi:3,4-dihydroxy 2-butanone 4-phosphate synthase/GTP cyclohydrolase II
MRDYTMAAQIINYFQMNEIKLLTNNPLKIEGLEKLGIKKIERVSIEIEATAKNGPYLFTKKNKMGHFLNQTLLKQ